MAQSFHEISVQYQKKEKMVLGAVYFGAVFLIIMIGLRGLGSAVESLPVPGFLLNEDGRLSPGWVAIALLVECLLLSALAVTTMQRPIHEEHDKPHKPDEKRHSMSVPGLDPNTVAQAEENLRKLDDLYKRFHLKMKENIAEMDVLNNEFREKLNNSFHARVDETFKQKLTELFNERMMIVEQINSAMQNKMNEAFREKIGGLKSYSSQVLEINTELEDSYQKTMRNLDNLKHLLGQKG